MFKHLSEIANDQLQELVEKQEEFCRELLEKSKKKEIAMNPKKTRLLADELVDVREQLARAIKDKVDGKSSEIFCLQIGMAYTKLHHIIEDFDVEYGFEDE